MISVAISRKVLTIGCPWKCPKGGIGVVLNSYSRIFAPFNVIINSNSVNFLANFIQLIYSLLATTFTLQFNNEIKIVHLHTASNNSFKRTSLFVYIAKFYNKKVVIHIHGGGFKEYAQQNLKFVLKVLDKCDVVIALTESWATYFKEQLGCRRVAVVPNIVELPCERKKKNNSRVKILFLGLLSQQKGVYDILEVCSKYKTELQDKVELHIGGNGDSKRLIEEINEKGLSDFVFYEGWVSGERKTQLLSESDIFILPSYAEGLPISLLEAMSYKLPVISTPVGGIPEIVEEGKNGLLIQPGNIDDLFCAIKALVVDGDVRDKMGEKALSMVQKHFPQQVAADLSGLYKSLLM